MSETNEKTVQLAPTCMVSVNRIVKLPVVESSIQTATNVYEKVKDLNGYTKWGFETFENTIQSVVETGKPYAIPVVQKLDGPIKKVDSVLCTGLDYVESKVPAVKLPPGEILSQLYTCTKGYVHDNVTPKVESACKTVHSVVDPTVEAAYKIVEPVVQPALDTAQAVKDKVEEFLHLEKNQTEAGNQAEAGPSSSADSKSDTESH
ncbi:hypothetical protein WA026_006361 [Henosepilachna vigintioctopunctata]|uniref:Uncharacterized protein n=1 Tax=Henosepilachna vigintioctopunctata TaxID=420089 RepID=A0AAW1TJB2_9CUCU